MKEFEQKGYFTNVDGTKSTDNVNQKPKISKDVVKPKRPLSAYLYFSMEAVVSIKEKDKLSHSDAMKKAGEVWAKMNDK